MPESFGENPKFKRAIWLIVVLFATIALVIAVTGAMVRHWRLPNSSSETGQTLKYRPARHLETAPQPALAAYLEEKNHLIDSYAWINKQEGLARIPVDVAMRAMAEGARYPGGPNPGNADIPTSSTGANKPVPSEHMK